MPEQLDGKFNVIETYSIKTDELDIETNIITSKQDFVKSYYLNFPSYGPGTNALLADLKKKLVEETMAVVDTLDAKTIERMKQKFKERANKILSKELPKAPEETKKTLIGVLLYDMLGLGKIELLLSDGNLEEIVINRSEEPIWVYHRKYGWLKTNVIIEREDDIENYANIIARRVGKQITILAPLLDAHLVTGDRANATLFPISSKGNTITIRRFRRDPWTVTDFIKTRTSSAELMALVWESMEYELNIIISGGTASGKTSLLNVCMPFIQPNHRILSIEDSVLPETELLCEKNGKFERTTIGELIDDAIGDQTMEDIAIDNNFGLKVFSMAQNGTIELCEPSKIYRHRVKKTVLEIEMESGKKISVTADHSLFTLGKKGVITPVSGKEIKKGSFLAAPRIMQYESKPVIFDLRKRLDCFRSAFLKSPVAEMAVVIKQNKAILANTNKSTIRNCEKKGMLKVETAALLAEIPKQSEIASKYGSFLPMDVEIDETLATAIGMWLADGSYDKNSVLFSVVEPECRAIIETLAKQHNINVKMHSDGITLMLNSCILKSFFEEVLELTGNSYTKRIPAWAFSLPEKEASALLRGYFSGDGWQRKYDTAIRSASLELLKDTQTMLLRFGIQMRFKNKRLKDKTFEARISETGNLKKFFEQVGFLQPAKMQKLKTASERNRHEISDIIPLPKEQYLEIKKELKKEIGKHYTYNSWKSWGTNYRNKSNISRSRLAEIAASSETLEKFKVIAENDLFWDKVTAVKEKLYDGFVYDFSVPENESFVCENMVCHNTRELMLPDFLHWVPMTTREPNPEGKGGITMLNLLVNSLRMRPDRVIVGEVRRKEEAEVMFEAMHTGHSVYTTLHANTADETITRLTNPPIDIPVSMLDSVHLNLVMFRNRRLGKRRMLEAAEFIPEKRGNQLDIKANVLFRWRSSDDKIVTHNESIRFFDELSLHTGLSIPEIKGEMETKRKILDWLVKFDIHNVNEVGKIIAEYYQDPEEIIKMMEKNKKPDLSQIMPEKKIQLPEIDRQNEMPL